MRSQNLLKDYYINIWSVGLDKLRCIIKTETTNNFTMAVKQELEISQFIFVKKISVVVQAFPS